MMEAWSGGSMLAIRGAAGWAARQDDDDIGRNEAVGVSQYSSSSATKKRGLDWSLISRQKQQHLAGSHGAALMRPLVDATETTGCIRG